MLFSKLPMTKTARWLWIAAISVSIWITTDWLTNWMLSSSYCSNSHIQINFYPKTQITRTLTITSIRAMIDRDNSIAEVTLVTENSTLKSLEFKFPLTEPNELKTALSRELNINTDVIQTLIRYDIE